MIWADGGTARIRLYDNPAAHHYHHVAKHLQHLALSFGDRENPYASSSLDRSILEDRFQQLAQRLDVDLDTKRLVQQSYLNNLHAIYFDALQTVPWNPAWLDFHDCIHLLEIKNDPSRGTRSIWFDYKHLAGPLEKKFDRSWLQYAVQQVPAGTCYQQNHELGKDLIECWKDQEPNHIDHLCRLSRPWIKIRAVLNLAVTDIEQSTTLEPQQMSDFLSWLSPVREAWCQHWQINDWQADEIRAMIPIGQIEDLSFVQSRFMSYNYPTRIRPCHMQN